MIGNKQSLPYAFYAFPILVLFQCLLWLAYAFFGQPLERMANQLLGNQIKVNLIYYISITLEGHSIRDRVVGQKESTDRARETDR